MGVGDDVRRPLYGDIRVQLGQTDDDAVHRPETDSTESLALSNPAGRRLSWRFPRGNHN